MSFSVSTAKLYDKAHSTSRAGFQDVARETMIKSQKAVEMTARLYEARDASKFLLGDRYDSKMSEYGDLIRKTMEAKKISEIAAAMLICSVIDSACQRLNILAALVEMTEPST